MLQLLETGKALYVLAVFCGLGVLTRMITGHLYKRLLKESTNLMATKNRRLKELRQRAENTYRLNQGMRDSGAWLEHQMSGLTFMGITLSGWSTLSMQCTWLCLLAGAVGAFASYWYRLDTYYIVMYGGGAVLLAMLTMLFDLGGTGSRKEQLLAALQDYLENVMCPRMARNLPLESSEEIRNTARSPLGARLTRGGQEGAEREASRFANTRAGDDLQTGRFGGARGVSDGRESPFASARSGNDMADRRFTGAHPETGGAQQDRRELSAAEQGGRELSGGRAGNEMIGRERAAAGTAAALSADSVVNGGRNGNVGKKLTGRAARRAAAAAAGKAGAGGAADSGGTAGGSMADSNAAGVLTGAVRAADADGMAGIDGAAEPGQSPGAYPGGDYEPRREVDYLKHSLEQIAASREKARAADENWLKDLKPEEVQLIGDILKEYLV